ncbi:hypothetical protein AQUCO_01100588v1 [Aquilegia coerulea]|uniref:Uncharacterized protein n=1 Tax=Aquilegia coerulea TaxID=218851 RepID=A0A2G5E7Q0_AQUCA|nr:hypothetical protein AQUCO_01100588v1 [Aquilegia coerulea]
MHRGHCSTPQLAGSRLWALRNSIKESKQRPILVLSPSTPFMCLALALKTSPSLSTITFLTDSATESLVNDPSFRSLGTSSPSFFPSNNLALRP